MNTTAAPTPTISFADALTAIRSMSSNHPGTRINGYAVLCWEGDRYTVMRQYRNMTYWTDMLTAEEAAQIVTDVTLTIEAR